jgi:hypothetical protein
MPATGRLDPTAHRLAVAMARASYACWYEALRDRRIDPVQDEARSAAVECLPMPEPAPGAGGFRA